MQIENCYKHKYDINVLVDKIKNGEATSKNNQTTADFIERYFWQKLIIFQRIIHVLIFLLSITM